MNRQLYFCWATIIFALGIFVIAYQESIKTLFRIWNEYGAYSHGYMTVLLAAYLIYICVKENRIDYSKPTVVSLIGLFLTSIVWLVSYLSGINIGQTLSLPFFVFFTITYFVGLRNYRVLFIPVFLLLLVVPIWSIFLPSLQGIATYLVNNILSFTTLEYQSSGNKIILASGIFEIEESCSGLRFLLVGVLLSIVFSFLNYKSYWSAFILILSSILIMLTANVVRILVIIAIGAKTEMTHPWVQDHASLGWVVFAIFLIPLFVLARRLDPNISIVEEENKLPVSGYEFVLSKRLIALVFYVATICFAPLYAQYAKNNINQVAKLDDDVGVLAGWSRLDLNRSKWELKYISYAQRYEAEYTKNKHKVDLSVYLYTKAVPGSELINFNNTLVDKDKWSIVSNNGNQQIMLENNVSSINVNKATIESDVLSECKRVWYWYEVDGEAYTKKLRVKLSEALMVIKGKSGSTINAVSTSCDENSDLILTEFLSDNMSRLKKLTIW